MGENSEFRYRFPLSNLLAPEELRRSTVWCAIPSRTPNLSLEYKARLVQQSIDYVPRNAAQRDFQPGDSRVYLFDLQRYRYGCRRIAGRVDPV